VGGVGGGGGGGTPPHDRAYSPESYTPGAGAEAEEADGAPLFPAGSRVAEAEGTMQRLDMSRGEDGGEERAAEGGPYGATSWSPATGKWKGIPAEGQRKLSPEREEKPASSPAEEQPGVSPPEEQLALSPAKGQAMIPDEGASSPEEAPRERHTSGGLAGTSWGARMEAARGDADAMGRRSVGGRDSAPLQITYGEMMSPLLPSAGDKELQARVSALRMALRREVLRNEAAETRLRGVKGGLEEQIEVEQRRNRRLFAKLKAVTGGTVGGEELQGDMYLEGSEQGAVGHGHGVGSEVGFMAALLAKREAEARALREELEKSAAEADAELAAREEEAERVALEAAEYRILYQARGRQLEELTQEGAHFKGQAEGDVARLAGELDLAQRKGADARANLEAALVDLEKAQALGEERGRRVAELEAQVAELETSVRLSRQEESALRARLKEAEGEAATGLHSQHVQAELDRLRATHASEVQALRAELKAAQEQPWAVGGFHLAPGAKAEEIDWLAVAKDGTSLAETEAALGRAKEVRLREENAALNAKLHSMREEANQERRDKIEALREQLTQECAAKEGELRGAMEKLERERLDELRADLERLLRNKEGLLRNDMELKGARALAKLQGELEAKTADQLAELEKKFRDQWIADAAKNAVDKVRGSPGLRADAYVQTTATVREEETESAVLVNPPPGRRSRAPLVEPKAAAANVSAWVQQVEPTSVPDDEEHAERMRELSGGRRNVVKEREVLARNLGSSPGEVLFAETPMVSRNPALLAGPAKGGMPLQSPADVFDLAGASPATTADSPSTPAGFVPRDRKARGAMGAPLPSVDERAATGAAGPSARDRDAPQPSAVPGSAVRPIQLAAFLDQATPTGEHRGALLTRRSDATDESAGEGRSSGSGVLLGSPPRYMPSGSPHRSPQLVSRDRSGPFVATNVRALRQDSAAPKAAATSTPASAECDFDLRISRLQRDLATLQTRLSGGSVSPGSRPPQADAPAAATPPSRSSPLRRGTAMARHTDSLRASHDRLAAAIARMRDETVRYGPAVPLAH